MRISIHIFFLIAILLSSLGCQSNQKVHDANTQMYDHVFLIPVKKPSESGEEFIKQKALEMSDKYGVNNIVAGGHEVSDEHWKEFITITLGMRRTNWNYTQNSMMKISYRRVHGLAVTKYKGKIQLLVDGKELGHFVVSQNGNLKGYLEEMERLRIYIPFL